MKIEQLQWTRAQNWKSPLSGLGAKANLVLVFGETELLKEEKMMRDLKSIYPQAHMFGCSTSGEIHGTRVSDDSVIATALQLEKTHVEMASLHISEATDSFAAGKRLAAQLPQENLSHVLVLSVGLGVNGSELVKGLTKELPKNVTLTGGLAGDQARFQETLVISDGVPSNDMIAIVGFYGRQIKINSASLGGWEPFGAERLITKASANVLYELDDKSALELYKKYLGEFAKDLPGSALLFPLSMRSDGSEGGLVRTVLGVSEKDQSLTFAGDVPVGSYVRFMKANFDRLIEGAIGAAANSVQSVRHSEPDLALLVSCVGRKIVLKQRVEEELEGVRDVFGSKTTLAGFYSYGEISPFTPNAKCELHNQTMTITTFSEKDDEAA